MCVRVRAPPRVRAKASETTRAQQRIIVCIRKPTPLWRRECATESACGKGCPTYRYAHKCRVAPGRVRACVRKHTSMRRRTHAYKRERTRARPRMHAKKCAYIYARKYGRTLTRSCARPAAYLHKRRRAQQLRRRMHTHTEYSASLSAYGCARMRTYACMVACVRERTAVCGRVRT